MRAKLKQVASVVPKAFGHPSQTLSFNGLYALRIVVSNPLRYRCSFGSWAIASGARQSARLHTHAMHNSKFVIQIIPFGVHFTYHRIDRIDRIGFSHRIIFSINKHIHKDPSIRTHPRTPCGRTGKFCFASYGHIRACCASQVLFRFMVC